MKLQGCPLSVPGPHLGADGAPALQLTTLCTRVRAQPQAMPPPTAEHALASQGQLSLPCHLSAGTRARASIWGAA